MINKKIQFLITIMLKDFEAKLYLKEYDTYSADYTKINNNEKVQYILNKENIKDKEIIDQIEPFINEIDKMKAPKKHKKKKIKKMKNYNIRKGDWQCKYCYNINFFMFFHFGIFYYII